MKINRIHFNIWNTIKTNNTNETGTNKKGVINLLFGNNFSNFLLEVVQSSVKALLKHHSKQGTLEGSYIRGGAYKRMYFLVYSGVDGPITGLGGV